MVTVKVPSTFYYDHINRDLPAGEVIKDYADGKSLIKFNSEALADLLSDAEFYVEMASDLNKEYFGLVQSARATVRAIKAQTEQVKLRT